MRYILTSAHKLQFMEININIISYVSNVCVKIAVWHEMISIEFSVFPGQHIVSPRLYKFDRLRLNYKVILWIKSCKAVQHTVQHAIKHAIKHAIQHAFQDEVYHSIMQSSIQSKILSTMQSSIQSSITCSTAFSPAYSSTSTAGCNQACNPSSIPLLCPACSPASKPACNPAHSPLVSPACNPACRFITRQYDTHCSLQCTADHRWRWSCLSIMREKNLWARLSILVSSNRLPQQVFVFFTADACLSLHTYFCLSFLTHLFICFKAFW